MDRPITYNDVRVFPGPVELVSRSVSNATGSSQALLDANPARRYLEIINPDDGGDWTINPIDATAAAVGAVPCFTLKPGDSWRPNPPPANAMTGIGTATSKLVILEG
jgi:hypothetical protein